ncbi:hypothetical protein [Maridesulfovibrio sp.]|uniref:hypothetical protein n=1 Tax=Maridesulfovibrio sp. TaxID=2795000 RepID=UPI0029CA9D3E|nr:hypothetical protein [Maridesulfovibrio sp.]
MFFSKENILAEAASQGLDLSGKTSGAIATFVACVLKRVLSESLPEAVYNCFKEHFM